MIVVSIVAATVWLAPAFAQPADEIEMDPQPIGSGSGSGSGSAKGSDAGKGSDGKVAKPDAAKGDAAKGDAAKGDAAKGDAAKGDAAKGDAAEPAVPVKDPKLAKKLQFTAQQLALQGDYFTRAKRADDAKAKYEGALTAFQKSIELGDDLAVYLELAGVEEKLGKLDDAARHVRLVATAATGVKPDVVKKAAAKLDDLATKVGMVTLAITPVGATISLGGTDIGKAPLDAPLILMPGSYTIALAAEGFQPKEFEIKVEAGSESERTIDLEAVKIVVEPVKPRPPEEPTELPPPPPSKTPLYIGAAATGALFTVSVITGIAAVSKHGTFVGESTSKADREDAQSSGKTLAHVSDICLVGTLAAAGITTYWYFYKYKKAGEKPKDGPKRLAPEMTKVDVVPWVQPMGNTTAGGLSIGGAF